MAPTDILLYLDIALLRYHQRSFLLQQMGSGTETHSQTCREALKYSALNLIFHQMSPLRALETLWKGRQTECRS